MMNMDPYVYRLKWLTVICLTLLAFFIISCEREKTELETEIVKGYWIHDFHPGTPISENSFPYDYCTKYTIDGKSIKYGFNNDGSVDTLHILRHQLKMEWNYFKDDNIFCISSSNGYDYLKFLKITADTLFFEADLCQTIPVNKGYIFQLVRYRPGCVPFCVADSNMMKIE